MAYDSQGNNNINPKEGNLQPNKAIRQSDAYTYNYSKLSAEDRLQMDLLENVVDEDYVDAYPPNPWHMTAKQVF